MKLQPPSDPQRGEPLAHRTVGNSAESVSHLSARLDELRLDLIERGLALESLRGQIETLERALTNRNALLSSAQAHLDTLHLALTRRQEECDSLVTSRSWKLTAPLRFAGRVLRRIEQYLAGRTDSPAGSVERDATLDRTPILKRELQETLGQPDNKTTEARYVHRVDDQLNADKLDIKAIAFYVPEFYPDPENAQWQRLGFADWTHFTKALPRYLGHYQPHLPLDLALNEQRIPNLTRSQIELARQYGVHGFCFQSYWTPLGRLTNQPLDQFLADPSLDFSFCVCCSDSSSQWEDDEANDGPVDWPSDDVFIGALSAVLSDQRCVRIDGKPVLIIHRAHRIPDVAARVRIWRDRARRMGLSGLYLVTMEQASDSLRGAGDFDAVLCDGLVRSVDDVTSSYPLIDSNFKGHIYDYESLIERQVEEPSRASGFSSLTFRNVITGRDSEALRPRSGNSFIGSSPAMYAKWLNVSCNLTMVHRPQERLVFISAWNSWGEGAHLEPDQRFGYAFLHATANVLRYYHQDPLAEELIAETNRKFVRTSDSAIIFHCYYEDLIAPIFDHYFSRNGGIDLFVTVRYDVSSRAIQEMRSKFPAIYFLREENRGRDIRPFLITLRVIRALGYRYACKVHTKKTPQALDQAGDVWRQTLIEPLLGSPDSPARMAGVFEREPELGLLVPKNSVTDLRILDHHTVNTFWLDRFLDRMDRRDLIGNYNFSFPAGSMYWFRVQALAGFEEMMLGPDEFEFELGQRDGTVAHAIERLVALYVQQRGYSMREIVES